MSAIKHLDLLVGDLERAIGFYSRLLNKEFVKVSDEYYRADWDQAPGLGLDGSRKPTGESACPFLGVEGSIEEAQVLVEKLGGTLLDSKMDLGQGRGYIIRIQDIEGNTVGIHAMK